MKAIRRWSTVFQVYLLNVIDGKKGRKEEKALPRIATKENTGMLSCNSALGLEICNSALRTLP
jgi:hypothetical protein